MADETPAAILSERLLRASLASTEMDEEKKRYQEWRERWDENAAGLWAAFQEVVDYPSDPGLVVEQLIRAGGILGGCGWSDLIPDGHEEHFGEGWGFACDLLRSVAAGANRDQLRSQLSESPEGTTLLRGVNWRYFRDDIGRGLTSRFGEEQAGEFPHLFPEQHRAWRLRSQQTTAGDASGTPNGQRATPSLVQPGAEEKVTDAGNGKVVPPVPQKSKKTKGKNIEARMLKLFMDEPHEVASWSLRQWALALDCAESTVCGTGVWKNKLTAVKALHRVDRRSE